MTELIKTGVYLKNGREIITNGDFLPTPDEARENTMAYQIMRAHSVSENKEKMSIKFDSLISHDITYVGIVENRYLYGFFTIARK